MNSLKKVIIILVALCIIVITILLILLNYQSKKETDLDYDEAEASWDINTNLEEKVYYTIRNVFDKNNFYMAQACVNKFYLFYTNVYDTQTSNYIIDEEAQTSIKNDQQEYAQAIYQMLDEEYINFAGITQENIITKLPKISQSVVNITNMYVSDQTDSISAYIVEGTLREKKSAKISSFQVMVKLDSSNKCFSIYLQDYINSKYPNLAIGNNINLQVQNAIEKNLYNTYDYINVSEEQYILDLFNQYKEELLYNQELAYRHLDEQYRIKRFGTLESFQTYAKANVRKNVIMELKQYQMTEGTDDTQYICIDQNGNYYLFKETAVMNYSVMLDTYTIDLPEFIAQYEAATNEEKVLMNIQKFFMAIDNSDYSYVYNKLDATYRANNFATLQEFEQYCKNTFFESNKLASSGAEKQNDVYLYTITITDKSGQKTESVRKTFVMQLKEGTDFVMSFSK